MTIEITYKCLKPRKLPTNVKPSRLRSTFHIVDDVKLVLICKDEDGDEWNEESCDSDSFENELVDGRKYLLQENSAYGTFSLLAVSNKLKMRK